MSHWTRFSPDSTSVVGPSASEGTLGYEVELDVADFDGQVRPVSLDGEEAAGS